MDTIPTTPHRPSNAFKSETPLKSNSAATNVFDIGLLDIQRAAVLRDLEYQVPEVSVEYMLQHVVPVSGVNLPLTLNAIKGLRSNGTWRAYNGLSPKQYAKWDRENTINEDEVFDPLKDIYRNIIENTRLVDRRRRPVTLKFDQQPSKPPKLTGATNVLKQTKPDGVGMILRSNAHHTQSPVTIDEVDLVEFDTYRKAKKDKETDYYYSWYDIVYTEEFKVKEDVGDLNDDVEKILWNLHHLMTSDPRRRFVFGLTIENENTRIWFCCRQSAIVSESFNFNRDLGYNNLVQFISSLAYASPSQLGYDDSVTLKWTPETHWQYNIHVGTHLYRTIRPILEASFTLRGRATRVWEVRSDTAHRNFIVKDSWMDTNREKEGDILGKLLLKASAAEKRLFLTVVAHGVVQIHGHDDSTIRYFRDLRVIEATEAASQGSENMTADWRMTKKLPKGRTAPKSMFLLYHHPPPSLPPATSPTSSTANTGTTASLIHHLPASPSPEHYVAHSHKMHYRIVFEEVGESFQSFADRGVASIGTLVCVLRDITTDVSPSNIIMVDQGTTAKLADLEFTKEYGGSQSSPIRTATYGFMSGQMMSQKYYWKPRVTPFLANPIHDMESLWWVGVWFAFGRYPIDDIRKAYAKKAIISNQITELATDFRAMFPTIESSPTDAITEARHNEIHDEEFFNDRRGGHTVHVTTSPIPRV